MPKGAPRRPLRPWRCPARGALLAGCLWLTGVGAGFACEAVTDGWGLKNRVAEAPLINRKPGGGRLEGWAPEGERLILHAGFDRLTDEYDHDILGPVKDAKALTIHIRLPGDNRVTCPAEVLLPGGEVFEDIAPRLADLDADGMPEIIVVQSSTTRGARLVVYDRHARLVAATPNIGQPHRWLAPLGAADLDGDGAVEIAYVDRPHLARVLRIWRLAGGVLTEIAAVPGVSNHRIGDPAISGGIRDCGDGPEMILASGDWRRTLALTLAGGALKARDLGPLTEGSLARALDCRAP